MIHIGSMHEEAHQIMTERCASLSPAKNEESQKRATDVCYRQENVRMPPSITRKKKKKINYQ